jgi:leucine dehydrogenase
VGTHLCRRLAEAGARLTVSDIHASAVDYARAEFSAAVAEPGDIMDVPADVFAPCALGAVIDDRTIPRLKARIVAGSANNQLAEPRHGAALALRGVLYAPDYVINAGGVIYISHEGPGFNEAQAFAHVARIHDTLAEIFQASERQGIPTSEAADRLARTRLKRPGTVAKAKAHAAA